MPKSSSKWQQRGFKPGLPQLRVWHSTTEPPRSINSIFSSHDRFRLITLVMNMRPMTEERPKLVECYIFMPQQFDQQMECDCL